MKTFRTLSFLILGLLSSRAQTVDDLMVTTALSTTGTDGANWVYVVWDSGNPALLPGRSFSINVKPGTAATPGNYVRQAVVKRTTDPKLILSQMTRAACMGEGLAQLDMMVRDTLTQFNGTVPGTREGRLAALIARNEPNIQQQILPILRRVSPAASMALGQAWAGAVQAAAGQQVTVEVREWDDATQSDRGVAGRTTVTVATHAPLPSSGAPWQLPDNTATGDLNIRLRWSMPDALLRRQMQFMGFTVWRAPKELAESMNWHITPPTYTQLNSAVPTGVRRLNSVPIRESKIFTAANVTNVTADPETYFAGDDNNRYVAGGAPFDDGDRFYYFTIPHDLLNRPGAVSPAGAGLACRVIPPPVPRDLTITASTTGGTGAGAGRQALVLTWKQNVNSGSDVTHDYQVFSAATAEAFNAGAPALTPLATLTHTGAETLSYEDLTAYTEDQTRWFTVRAVHHGPRGDVVSTSAPPVPGVRRNLAPATAPAPGDTFTAGFCPRCVLTNPTLSTPPLPAGVAPWTVRIQVTRQSADVAWVDIQNNLLTGTEKTTRVYFPDNDNVLTHDLLTEPVSNHPNYDLALRAAAMEGTRSNLITAKAGTSGSATTLLTLSMTAALLDAGQIRSSNPLAAYVIGASVPLTNAISTLGNTRLVSAGITVGTTSVPDGTDMLVQQGATDIGVAQVWKQRVIFAAAPGSGYSARTILVHDTTACSRGYHSTRTLNGPKQNGILTGFYPTANTREYRIYRQVDRGGLSLVKQGEIPASGFAGSGANLVALQDFGLPSNAACLNYFLQLFDKSGNGSPLIRLGMCVQTTVPLPVPVMGLPVFTGTAAAPRVQLRWTCVPDGVEQFEIWLRPKTGMPMAEVPPGDIWGSTRAQTTAVPVSRFKDPTVRHSIFSPRDAASGQATGKRNAPGTGFLTPRIGNGPGALGSGPLFTMEFGISAGVEYEAWIAALGPGPATSHVRGAFSEVISFRALPPPPPPDPNCVVPWPYRQLPPVVTFHPEVRAQRFVPGPGETPGNVMGEVPVWPIDHDSAPVGVKIGRITALSDGRGGGSVAGAGTPSDPSDDDLLFASENFNKSIHIKLDEHIYAAEENSPLEGTRLLPAVLYRQQVVNAAFPAVPGTVVQCSPMITKIAAQNLGSGDVRLHDPFIGVTAVNTRSATDLRPVVAPVPSTAQIYLHLLDTKPVLTGARYQYWLVRFQPNGEPAEVVDAGQVDIP